MQIRYDDGHSPLYVGELIPESLADARLVCRLIATNLHDESEMLGIQLQANHPSLRHTTAQAIREHQATLAKARTGYLKAAQQSTVEEMATIWQTECYAGSDGGECFGLMQFLGV